MFLFVFIPIKPYHLLIRNIFLLVYIIIPFTLPTHTSFNEIPHNLTLSANDFFNKI
jgi:hypothetical protein